MTRQAATHRQLVAEEATILEMTEAVWARLHASGFSKADLAKMLGVTPQYIRSALDGRRNLTIRSLARIADALGCDVRVRLVTKRVERDEHANSRNGDKTTVEGGALRVQRRRST